jgi:hypothetical protein
MSESATTSVGSARGTERSQATNDRQRAFFPPCPHLTRSDTHGTRQ